MKIVFFGTSSFAERILIALFQNEVDVVAVVTRKDQPFGRNLQYKSPPVKETSVRMRPYIPVFQPEKASTPEFVETLQSFNPDLFVVVAYGEIIKKNLLELPRLGCINIHASLLPKYRGAAPIQRCLMEGETKSGITIIEMTSQMDAGDILAMEEISIPIDMCFGELEPLLCGIGSRLILKVIQQFDTESIIKIPQDHTRVTFAPKILPNDEKINWDQPALKIHNQIRALSPFPGAWTMIHLANEKKRLKIKKSLPITDFKGSVGNIHSFNKENGWIIGCGKGALKLLEVQLEGKKTMSADDFIRGTKTPPIIAEQS